MDDKNSEIGRLKNIIIDEEYYTNLLGMLNASEEDRLIGLQCIKKLNPARNFVAIAFLRKNSKTTTDEWNKNCKTIIAFQETLGLATNGPLKFKDIYKAMKKEKEYKEENGKFFTVRYIEYLQKNLVEMDFIESVEINVKLKGYDK